MSLVVGTIVLYRPTEKKLLGTEEVLPALVLQRSPENQESANLVDLAVFGANGGMSLAREVACCAADSRLDNTCWPR